MKLPPFYDFLGAVVTVVLLLAVIAYPLFGHGIPQILESSFAAAMGWVFRGGVGAANDFLHQRKGAPNGAATTTGPASPSAR